MQSGPRIVRDRLQGTERVLCVDADSGKLNWKHESDEPYFMSYPGPRCTPTVDGDRVYTLGVEGSLSCLDAAGFTCSFASVLMTTQIRQSVPLGESNSRNLVTDIPSRRHCQRSGPLARGQVSAGFSTRRAHPAGRE
jgi:hypothetical protein